MVTIAYDLIGGGGGLTSNNWFNVSSTPLPSDFRPSTTIYAPIINHGNNGFRGTLRIESNGNVSIKTLNTQTAFDCVGNITYSV